MNTETNSLPKPSKVIVRWHDAMRFEADVPSGASLKFDSPADGGQNPDAPSPLEAFIACAAACSAMDVISILDKKRQVVTSYRVEVTWERDVSGDWPHPITAITLNHLVSGKDLDESSVHHAVAFSDEKYCTVVATLRAAPQVSSIFSIVSDATK